MLSDDSRTFVGSLRSDVAVCVRSPCDEPHRARLNPGNGFPKKLIKPGGIGPKPPTRTGCGMAAFITHPSVRIKGTEHNYNPVLCQDDQCAASSKGSHMHCPFCSVTEAYQDPVILRAHYRVKHVDKGLDFAAMHWAESFKRGFCKSFQLYETAKGLKVLRCCNHCEIVGTIKGEKKFKGAHWHCYRCRNGFNRRDEAVKHYKTHFRNPHTTFQIQITQSSEVLEQNLLLEKQLIELHQQNQQLQIEKAEMEKKLKAEIQQLKDHIVSVVQANVRMAEELRRYRSSEDIEKRISKMPEHGKLSYLQGVLRG
nr:PREDICTED: uncharacterized protein LOC102362984 [Latimeria chalumnae]|eukprot:XP_014351588.1 PREDICTED: uncharacterized protein LOC102362984 [Latimeria chalumnae]